MSNNKMKKKVIWISLLLTIELLFVIVFFMTARKEKLLYEVAKNDRLEVFDDLQDVTKSTDGISIVRQEETFEKLQSFVRTSDVCIPKGTYDITIYYNTDTGGNLYRIFGNRIENIRPRLYQDICGYLPANNNERTCHIRSMKSTDDFEVRIYYTGTGHLEINKITFQETNDLAKIKTSCVAVFIILLDLIWVFRIKIYNFVRKNKYIMAIIVLCIFSTLILFKKGIYENVDAGFHMLRIQGLKDALLSGQFPARIHPTHMKGYGYATGIMYPEYFMYIPAVMMILLGISLEMAYKSFFLIITFLTAVSFFYSFKEILKRVDIAFIGTVVYILSPYRIYDLYSRAALGEVSAMLGIPLVMLGIYLLIVANRKEELRYFPFVMGYTAIIGSHIITSVFAAIFTIITILIFIKRILNKDKILFLLKMAFMTLGVNAFFIVPFLDYYRLPFNSYQYHIQQYGLSLFQAFTHNYKELIIGNGGKAGIGFSIIALNIIFLLTIRNKYNMKKIGITSFGIGLIAFLFCLKVFPWSIIEKIPYCFSIISNFQFPWRFYVIAIPCFILSGCVGLSNLKPKTLKIASVIILLIAIAEYIPLLYELNHVELYEFSYRGMDTDDVGIIGEYMLQGTDYDSFKSRGNIIEASSNQIHCYHYDNYGSSAWFALSSESKKSEFIELPIIMYPGYQVYSLDHKQKFELTYGTNNLIRVTIPPQFKGKLGVCFTEPWYWRVSEIVSIFTIGLLCYILWKKKRERISL